MNLRDPQTFARVYAEHAPAAGRAAAAVLGPAGRRSDVEDVVHDVFLRLWRDPAVYDAARGTLATYVPMVARSRAMDLCRSAGAASRASERVGARSPRPDPSADPVAAEVERDVARAALLRALATLPTAQRDAIALACWGDMTARQIADHAGVPVGTVKGRIRLGLARLRGELDRSELPVASIVSMIASIL